jgi:hypothetical protein
MKLLINAFTKHSMQLVCCFCTVLLTFSFSKAQTLLTESFNYSSGTLVTINNWVALSGTGTNNVTVSNGNLAFPGSIGNGMGSKIPLANNGQDVYRTFTSTAAPIYTSLIVNVSAANATGDFFYSLGTSAAPATTVGAKLFVRSNGAGFSFGVLRGTGGTPVYETTVRPFNTNVMAVLKYEVVPGATNDAVKLFVNPALASEPAIADVTYNATVGADAGVFSAIALLQGTAAAAPTLEVDGINVGTTWASVTSPIYDYGDVPATYDFTKDGVYAPAAHSLLAGLALGSNIPDLELSPLSVAAAGADNNASNGDGADEDAIDVSDNQIRKGISFTLSVPVKNPTATNKYLYGWIDFNNDGIFQAGEFATRTFTAVGPTNQALTWTAAQTATMAAGTPKLYMRLRLSDRLLNDFTTPAGGGALIDERAVGNGAVSAANAADFGVAANGEVEDYQIDVVTTFDYGDAPSTFENDKDGNPLPGLNAPLSGFSIGSLLDVESTPASVTSPDENNTSGDNTTGQADEDAIDVSANQIRKGLPFTLSVPVTNPTATNKYLYGWIDFNNDGKFQAGELSDAIITFSTTGATTQTLTWPAAKTASITTATRLYMRLRLSDQSLKDFTTPAGGGALIDERSIGNGAIAAGTATNSPTVAFGEIEDYQLQVIEVLTCTGATTKIPIGGTITVNGVQVTSSAASGDLEYYPYYAASCTGNNLGPGSLWLGRSSSWSLTLTFSKPVNDLVFLLTGAGANGGSENENFIFNSNGGAVSIFSDNSCYSTIIGNTLLSGAGAPVDGDYAGGGVFRISAPSAYTTLTINGDGGWNGTVIAMCAASITPQPPIISSITPDEQTVCKNAAPGAITATATGTGTLNYQWYKNTTNTNVGGTIIAGATSASYTPPATSVIGTGYYYVIITDDNASTTSPAVSVITNNCETSCYKPGITTGTALDGKVGITSLSRAGVEDPDHWPMVRKGAWMVLESKTKGFVLNRLSFDGAGNPVGIPPADFVEGMMVYDTTNNCLKVYTLTDGGTTLSWQCLNTQTCPD